MALSVAAPLLLSACGGSQPSSSTGVGANTSGSSQLTLVSYAVTKAAYDRILPRFREAWKARTGQDITIRSSYGPSAAQTRAVIDGLDADLVTLPLPADVLKLQQAGLINPGWEARLPYNANITHSVVALIPRPGNPKGVRDWPDLARPGVAVLTANPKTSGGARWNFLGLWGSVSQTGGSEQQAADYVRSIYRNVSNLPKDAREATDTFLKRGQGDVLLNYENEAIQARRQGELKQDFIIPAVNIRIEGPVAVVDRNVDRRGTRKAAEALAVYLSGEDAQRIFAEEGFRPANPAVWQEVRGRFAPVQRLFTAADFGGWAAIDQTFFGKQGLWDKLFTSTR
ncbi:MAG: sulfate ABC transporter substrate-binding protein [Synechococcaceae cyanobacterium]|nr:sulfate ABC transporter substrate-binding protein [Synechococcaceae cyanobacterium]